MTKTLCEKCHLKPTCKQLCDTAEKYISVEVIPQRRNTCAYNDKQLYISLEINKPIYLTKTERQILTLLGQGLYRRDIAQILGKTRNSIRWHIHNLKIKYNRNK